MQAMWLAASTILTALIVAGGAYATAWLNARQIRQGKEQDYARQDEVAAQLEQRQDKAEAKAAQVAELLLASNKRVEKQAAAVAEVTDGKLNQIHELVNSTLTSQIEESHGALTQQLVLMREVIALHKAAGRKPSADALESIQVIERKVAELAAKLSDRAAATKIADASLTHQGG